MTDFHVIATYCDPILFNSNAFCRFRFMHGGAGYMLPMAGGMSDIDQCDSSEAIYNYIPSTCLMEYEVAFDIQ